MFIASETHVRVLVNYIEFGFFGFLVTGFETNGNEPDDTYQRDFYVTNEGRISYGSTAFTDNLFKRKFLPAALPVYQYRMKPVRATYIRFDSKYCEFVM